MGYPIGRNQTAQPLVFLMVDATDGKSPKPDLSPTVTLSKNGAAFASPAGAVSEIGVGWYKVAGNATDSSAFGPLVLHAEADGADPQDEIFQVVAYDPLDAAALGLSRLDAAVSSRSIYAGADTAGTTTLLSRVTGDVALASQIPTDFTADLFQAAGVFSTGALANSPTGGTAPTVAQIRTEMDANSTKFATLVSGVRLTSDGLDPVIVEVAAGGAPQINARQALALVVDAAGSGILSGAATSTVTVKNPGGTATRIVATCDTSGNRSAVMLTPPS